MIGLFPFAILLALLAAAALTYAVVNVIKRFKSRRPPGWRQVLLVLAPLLVIDALLCFFILVSAGLSHSARLIELAPVKCGVVSFAIVALPLLVLVFYRPKNS